MQGKGTESAAREQTAETRECRESASSAEVDACYRRACVEKCVPKQGCASNGKEKMMTSATASLPTIMNGSEGS